MLRQGGVTMKKSTLNKCEDFTFEDRLMNITSNDGLYKKGSPRIKPLTVAVSIILTGLSFSSQVGAKGFDSPWIIDGTENLSGYNEFNVPQANPNTIVTATIYGTVNFSNSYDTYLYTNYKFGLPYDSYNSITVYGQLNGSDVKASNLMGAYTTDRFSVSIQNNYNTVIFKAGSIVKNVHVYGAKINNYDNSGFLPSNCVELSEASFNTVIIEKGSDYTGVNKYVVGGYAIANNTATASNNKVIIGAGKLEGTESLIIAGWTSTADDTYQATMCDNEVYLYGDADMSKVDIYGGVRTAPNNFLNNKDNLDTTVMTGNTLIFGYDNKSWEPVNYTIKSVNNFSTIRMDTVVWGKTITINSLSNHSTDSSETKIDATNISFSGVDNIAPGDSYDLLTVSNIPSGSVGLTSESSSFTLGSSLEGTAKVTQSGNTFSYTVNSLDPQPQTHTAAMTMSAGTVALTQGGDTLSAAGFNLANSGINGTQAFSAVGGGMARVNTGSHVNVNTLNFSVGVGNNIQNDFGQLSVGGAFEAGFGKFKNHFNAGKADSYIKKNGDIKYYGIAVLSNMAFENLWHVNGALRYGRIETSQNRAVYNFNTNQAYDVDLSSYYS